MRGQTSAEFLTSRVGFGTASLHHIASSRRRQAILEQALDLGIRHFDTARMYGNGLAEREVGLLAHRRRAEMFIATKFGIDADPMLEKHPSLQLPVKALQRFGVLKRETTTKDRFSVGNATRNLALSLQALRTDYVDLLLLHEPTTEDVSAIDALGDWANRMRASGAIRHFGLAGQNAVEVVATLQASPWSEVVQAPVSANDIGTNRIPQIVYGIYSAGASGKNVLADALQKYPNRTILISTAKSDRLLAASEAVAAAAGNTSR